MATETLYCPNCFAMIPADASVCTFCSADIGEISGRDFRDKLLHTLEHPLDDMRMRAIISLGLRGEAGTALPMAECALRHPLNIEEGLEVIERLRHFAPSPEVFSSLQMLLKHEAHAVREAAARAILFASAQYS